MKTIPKGPFLAFLRFFVRFASEFFRIKNTEMNKGAVFHYSRAPLAVRLHSFFHADAAYPGFRCNSSLRYRKCQLFGYLSKRVNLGFFGHVRRMGEFSRVVVPEKNLLSVNRYSGFEFLLSGMPMSAKKTCFVLAMGRALISLVLADRCNSKIADPVIRRNPIDMVYKTFRPVAINVKPSESMRFVASISDSDLATTICPAGSSDITHLCSSARYTPNKLPGIRVVIKQFAQAICGQFFFYNTVSHDDSSKARLVRACVATQTPHRLVQFTGAA